MDSYREFPSDHEPAAASDPAGDDAPTSTVTLDIGTDERRMHVRAYNYWVSLLDGRDFPSIEDLEPNDLNDFSANSVLLDFTCGRDNPAVPFIGAGIREECGLDDDMRMISDVPSRSLLSRLTDHYMQIIANRAPVGFEAEFVNQRGDNICYRGILMPFSSDGDTIDFIYGVINWKTEDLDARPAAQPLVAALPPAHIVDFSDEQTAELAALDAPTALDDEAVLADRLCAARDCAEAAKAGEGRTRAALYTALASAYDFALCARDNPQDFAELLADSGVKAQARAPMTPVVKLVFGIDYDKARLTEFAAALSFADRSRVERGGFDAFITSSHGGLKALVASERAARRPHAKPDDRGAEARSTLRQAAPLSLADLGDTSEFAVIVTRRGANGKHEAIAVLTDEALVERVIRKVA